MRKTALFVFAFVLVLSTSMFWSVNGQSVSINKFLPTREQIPTKWATGGISEIYLNDSGFLEGARSNWNQWEKSGAEVVFYVYRFSDTVSAKAFYDSQVNPIKAKGGYEEVAIPQVFAEYVHIDYYEKYGISWGTQENIVFNVYTFSDSLEDPKENLITFTNLERTIVEQQLNSKLPPEPDSTSPDSTNTQDSASYPDMTGSFLLFIAAILILVIVFLAVMVFIKRRQSKEHEMKG